MSVPSLACVGQHVELGRSGGGGDAILLLVLVAERCSGLPVSFVVAAAFVFPHVSRGSYAEFHSRVVPLHVFRFSRQFPHAWREPARRRWFWG